jgi:hypothetical protein
LICRGQVILASVLQQRQNARNALSLDSNYQKY